MDFGDGFKAVKPVIKSLCSTDPHEIVKVSLPSRLLVVLWYFKERGISSLITSRAVNTQFSFVIRRFFCFPLNSFPVREIEMRSLHLDDPKLIDAE